MMAVEMVNVCRSKYVMEVGYLRLDAPTQLYQLTRRGICGGFYLGSLVWTTRSRWMTFARVSHPLIQNIDF